MFSLGIDSATRQVSISLIDNQENVIAELQGGDYAAESILQLIHEALFLGKISLKDLQIIGVSTGPGSFTGIRCGVASALGLCLGEKTPLIGIPALVARAIPHLREPEILIPYMEAAGEENYFSIFRIAENTGERAAFNSLECPLEKIYFFSRFTLSELSAPKVASQENFMQKIEKAVHSEGTRIDEKEKFSWRIIDVQTLPSPYTKSSTLVAKAAFCQLKYGQGTNFVLRSNLSEPFRILPSQNLQSLTPIYIKKVQAKTLIERGLFVQKEKKV